MGKFKDMAIEQMNWPPVDRSTVKEWINETWIKMGGSVDKDQEFIDGYRMWAQQWQELELQEEVPAGEIKLPIGHPYVRKIESDPRKPEQMNQCNHKYVEKALFSSTFWACEKCGKELGH